MGKWLTPRHGRFTPEKERLGGPQGWSGRVRNISAPPGFDPRTAQPIAGLYTDYVIPVHPAFLLRTKTSQKNDIWLTNYK